MDPTDKSFRTWTASSNWIPASRGSISDAVSFETFADDADQLPDNGGILLVRPDSDDAPPCEVTISLSGKHEIHRVYVRSTARVYEIYCATNLQNNSKEYLCTVRCGPTIEENVPASSAQRTFAASHSSGEGTMEKKEHDTGSDASNSDEDGWVEVNVLDSPMQTYTSSSSSGATSGAFCTNTLKHFEATAEISDATPCVSLIIRLLSLQTKASVHIEEIYIFADPVESTDHDSVMPSGDLRRSSLMGMLIPGLLQISKPRIGRTDDKKISECSGMQSSLDPMDKKIQSCSFGMERACAEMLSGVRDVKLYSASEQLAINNADGSPGSNEKSNCRDLCSSEGNSKPGTLHEDNKENPKDVLFTSRQKGTDPDQLKDYMIKENPLPYRRVEMLLDTLVSKVEKIESRCSRLEDNIVKPLSCIEARLERLEEHFNSFAVEIQSLRSSSVRVSASELSCNPAHSKDKGTNVDDVVGNKRCQGLVLKAPDFSPDGSCDSKLQADCGPVSRCEPKMMPGLVVKAPEFLCEPDSPCENNPAPLLPADAVAASVTASNTCPGLVIRAREFGNEDDDNTTSVNSLQKGACESLKGKKPLSIDGALVSALAAFVASSKEATPEVVASPRAHPSSNGTNVESGSSICPENVDSTCSNSALDEHIHGTFGEQESNVVVLAPSEDESELILDTSLGKPDKQHKICDETEEHNGHSFKTGEVASSLPPLEFTPRSLGEKEFIECSNCCADERTVGIENGPSLPLAAFLASRNMSSSTVTSFDLNPSAELPSVVETVAPFHFSLSSSIEKSDEFIGAGSNNMIQQADGLTDHETENLGKKPIEAIFEGLYHTACDHASEQKDNVGYSHMGILVGAALLEEGLKSAQNSIFSSAGSKFAVDHLCFSSSRADRRSMEDNSTDSSLDENVTKAKFPICWSDDSSVESLGGASSRYAVIHGSSEPSIGSSEHQDDLTSGMQAARLQEDIQWDWNSLFVHPYNNMAANLTPEVETKSNPSLDVLPSEVSDTDSHLSVLDDGENAIPSDCRLLDSSSSSKVFTSSMDGFLNCGEDLRTPPTAIYPGSSEAANPVSLI